MPFICFLLTYIFGLDDGTPLGRARCLALTLFGCCPGTVFSHLATFLSKGDVAMAVAMSFLSQVFLFLSFPIWLYLLYALRFEDESMQKHLTDYTIMFEISGLPGTIFLAGLVAFWALQMGNFCGFMVRAYYSEKSMRVFQASWTVVSMGCVIGLLIGFIGSLAGSDHDLPGNYTIGCILLILINYIVMMLLVVALKASAPVKSAIVHGVSCRDPSFGVVVFGLTFDMQSDAFLTGILGLMLMTVVMWVTALCMSAVFRFMSNRSAPEPDSMTS